MGHIVISDRAYLTLGTAKRALPATVAGLDAQSVFLDLQALPAQLKDA
jgi:hypothetical protein